MKRLLWLLLGLLVGVTLVGPPLFSQNQGATAPTRPLTFFDANGDPLVSGTVSTYVSGTSTSAVTYDNQTLNSSNANAYTQDGIAGPNYVAEQQAMELGCDGRLTLTSGVPVTTVSVTDATTIYFTPYVGNRCALCDGANWRHVTFSETSLSLGTNAANTNWDVFAYLAGTP